MTRTHATRLVLYTGKGGVGKTTTSAATAVHAAALGTRVLAVSTDAAHSLGDVLGQRLHGDPIRVSERLDALELDAREEMARHWGRIRDYLVALFRYQGIEEVVAEELALLPGAEELTSLLAVEEYARSGAPDGEPYDLIVVDCAPTDAALRMVTLPEVARSAFRLLLRAQEALSAVVTPLARGVLPVPLPDAGVFREAEHLLYRKLRRLQRELVSERASVRLVVTPERMGIDEARRTYTDLCLFGMPCDAVVMNRMLPPEAGKEAFFRDWLRVQDERRQELEELFAPLHVLEAPLQDDEVTGLERLAGHGRALFGSLEPGRRLSTSPRLRFEREPGGQPGYAVRVPLPGIGAGDPVAEQALASLDVAAVAGELVVRVGARRRSVVLPRRIAQLDLARAELEGDTLTVHFVPGEDGSAA